MESCRPLRIEVTAVVPRRGGLSLGAVSRVGPKCRRQNTFAVKIGELQRRQHASHGTSSRRRQARIVKLNEAGAWRETAREEWHGSGVELSALQCAESDELDVRYRREVLAAFRSRVFFLGATDPGTSACVGCMEMPATFILPWCMPSSPCPPPFAPPQLFSEIDGTRGPRVTNGG